VPNKTPDPTFPQVQSVARAAELLEITAGKGAEGISLTEIASRLGVAKSTALALARTLCAAGLLRTIEPGPMYVLGLTLLRLGDLVAQQTSIVEIASPVVRRLAEQTGFTTRLAVNEEGFPVFVERIDGPGSVRFHAPLGQREEPHATAAGKAILAEQRDEEVDRVLSLTAMARYTAHTIVDREQLKAELARIRAEGYATDDEEEAEGIFCVGAAFRNHAGECLGALSVTGLKVDIPLREVRELGNLVRAHADELTVLLGGTVRTPSSINH